MAATTFRPPSAPAVKPARKKINPLVPSLGAVCAVLAGASGYFFTQVNSKTAGLSALGSGVLSVAEAAGSGAVTAEDLVNPVMAGDALQKLADEVKALVTGGETARAELDRQRVQAAEMTAQLDAGAVRLAEAQQQLDATRAELQTARSDVQVARKALETLQANYDNDVDALNKRIQTLTAEVDELKQPSQSMADAESGSVSPVEADASGEVAVETATTREEDKEHSMVVPPGTSQLFKTVRFEEGKNRLTFVTMNDTKLVYSKVPRDIYDGLAAAPVLDIFYRFKIFDVYESSPKDLDVLRDMRRN